MAFYAIDQDLDRSPTLGIRRRLAVALLAAALVHLLILFVVRVDWPDSSARPGLLVTLVKPTPVSPVSERVPAPIVVESSVVEPTVVESAVLVTEIPPVPNATWSPPGPVSTRPEPAPPGDALAPHGRQLYSRAIQSIRVDGQRGAAGVGGLSESDFAGAGSGLPVLVSKPTRVESEDQVMGFVMVKMTDGFGNILCVQERGDWGDWGAKWKAADKMKNPPLFYKVKEGMCGHMK